VVRPIRTLYRVLLVTDLVTGVAVADFVVMAFPLVAPVIKRPEKVVAGAPKPPCWGPPQLRLPEVEPPKQLQAAL
jgi:hypothetical protein